MVSLLIGPEGLINILPVVEVADIPKAVAYIRAHFDEGIYVCNLISFGSIFLVLGASSIPRLIGIFVIF